MFCFYSRLETKIYWDILYMLMLCIFMYVGKKRMNLVIKGEIQVHGLRSYTGG